MLSKLIPAVLAASLGLAGAAFAATTTQGTIKAFDMAKLTLTLQDGTVYTLPAGFKDPGFKVGEKVAVTWDMMGANHEATDVKISS